MTLITLEYYIGCNCVYLLLFLDILYEIIAHTDISTEILLQCSHRKLSITFLN